MAKSAVDIAEHCIVWRKLWGAPHAERSGTPVVAQRYSPALQNATCPQEPGGVQ
jgi:hypothetical protein